MSKKFTWNENWKFTKDAVAITDRTTSVGNWETLNLPHTWNGDDGQDGGSDYYRGTCYYAKNLSKAEIAEGKEVYIEFEAANSSAELFVNGESVAKHDGGYSTWRANITSYLKEENEIVVAVDNAPNDHVYPQNADFTFYGGLYRKVSLLLVDETRFDLDYYGSPAIKVTPEVTGQDAKITTEVYLTNAGSQEELVYTITDGDTVVDTVTVCADQTKAEQTITNVHLWNGRKDPHLYTMHVELKKDGQVIDERTTRFGCRTFKVDPEKGFFLNGEYYPLRGVSRHQDRPHIGNALTPEMHEEDAKIIYELGATTIRLAHYQHDQYFYDLCDELGFVLWAEIPYISVHMPNGRENTVSQMKELVVQNYNHPSIFFWGLSNEITMKGAKDPDLLENHHILNDMVHEMDKTRLTTMAVISMCDISESQYIEIPDLVSYNQYLGWYGGKIEQNGPFMDAFHEMYPNIPIGMSEYGAEAYKWHTSHPEQGDYTEEYQAHYHEELIKQLYTRDFVWATHVWNMFDFAADARDEGGCKGMNNKGLVTFDRKYKKDAFYAYKAWLSDEPFVHLCSKNYVDRDEDVTTVKVYSNLPEVELFVNGESVGKQNAEDHFFTFEVKNVGETTLIAKAGDYEDSATIRKVDEPNPDYHMPVTGDVINWFEITAPEGYFSINDTMGEIMANPEGAKFMGGMMAKMQESQQNPSEDDPQKGMKAMANQIEPEAAQKMMMGFTVKRMLGFGGLPKEQVLGINAMLNKIKK